MVIGSLWVCTKAVVDASVSTYLGWRAWYSITVCRYGTVNEYPKPNSQDWKANIIIPYSSYFITNLHLPLWVQILLMNIYCLNIASYWPKKLLDVLPDSSWQSTKLKKVLSCHFFLQYLKIVVVSWHDTLPNEQHNWSLFGHVVF